ncbi:hypothetical protein [Chitinivorax sp. B]|uniref:hypothetical protein n=1 Tax=Chitinivorax sp. B TaxID=2502235 RepID=UPI0010F727FC|nr:hypothetical protein [Chitinivorax sp. B]
MQTADGLSHCSSAEAVSGLGLAAWSTGEREACLSAVRDWVALSRLAYDVEAEPADRAVALGSLREVMCDLAEAGFFELFAMRDGEMALQLSLPMRLPSQPVSWWPSAMLRTIPDHTGSRER